MKVTTLNTLGDVKSEFDTTAPAGREDMAELFTDMLRKGYALYLEDGDDTERIMGYDAKTNTFEIRQSRDAGKKKKVRIVARRERNESDKPKRGRPAGQRVNAVAPQAGG